MKHKTNPMAMIQLAAARKRQYARQMATPVQPSAMATPVPSSKIPDGNATMIEALCNQMEIHL